MSTITAPQPTAAPGLSLHRLHLMRAGYLFMAVGITLVKGPLVLDGLDSLPLFEGVVACMLLAMALLSLVGLRHPVAMLPVLVFESAWKLLWLGLVALPRVTAGDLDPAAQEVLVNCSLVVVILAVTPWPYVWRRYVSAKGDRWR